MPAALTNESRTLPPAIHRLTDLSYNLWFSWNEEALKLFKSMDPVKWEQSGHNPVQLLQELEPSRLHDLCQDTAFMEAYKRIISEFDQYMNGASWFQSSHPEQSFVKIAYFSAEFGFHESLPIYSGGLGILAGDHCKSASDLGVPLTGIGLLYKKRLLHAEIRFSR
ncbi:DUF3417 domain-containing protein [Paenibacillus hexagrammi]|uniref:DUF3417 domain-containing protein n=1 Tax=Paenibacillus hexagrammi TaxID=2908839 RepID=A0ABY3SGK2_9BACL|nr:DUF3417 domain-containing protein [Paenibacillus sp. YPD9-1]UJF32331.1 DUF3417 domain-containing protein [Paenibacillus sp. YPD9-1]